MAAEIENVANDAMGTIRTHHNVLSIVIAGNLPSTA